MGQIIKTFVECHSAAASDKVVYAVLNKWIFSLDLNMDSVTVDDSRRQWVPNCRCSAAEGSFPDVSPSGGHIEKWSGRWLWLTRLLNDLYLYSTSAFKYYSYKMSWYDLYNTAMFRTSDEVSTDQNMWTCHCQVTSDCWMADPGHCCLTNAAVWR